MRKALPRRRAARLKRASAAPAHLPGIGRKTANVILGTAFHKNEGVVVDTHVQRVANRLGLANAKEPQKTEKQLMQKIPQKDWTIFSHEVIDHGRKICKAKNPQCERCFLQDLCPFAQAVLNNTKDETA
jgi:endonuclease-3